ncbi:MAG: hypothetical protein JOZ08_02285 [Verrucomicrobia bacterium]|nr:hypothetical protein [Verrucomicrobiota bacterium]MBV8280345.1 hypothetical protein [Verrucomicrobiota bacterium]
MLTQTIKALRWTEEKLENLLAHFAANYARELLMAHGLVEVEIDHIRRNLKTGPARATTENTSIDRSIPSNGGPSTQTHLEVFKAERPSRSIDGVTSLGAATSNCSLWSGPEIVAALCVAGAAIAGLLFCLAAIFKS